METRDLDLSGVSETMLLTLFCRASETKSKDPVLVDHDAVEMANKIRKMLATSDKPMFRAIALGAFPIGCLPRFRFAQGLSTVTWRPFSGSTRTGLS